MPPKRESLASTVERTLLSRMIDGQYAEGFRLPAEVDLAEGLAVSRSIVREALKRLERSGVIRTVHGSGGGSFVQRPNISALTDMMYLFLQLNGVTIDNLREARMLLAPQMAALAAARATPEDIEELEQIWSRKGEPPETAGGVIMEFHLKLASMTRNPALEAAARPLIQLFTAVFDPVASKAASKAAAKGIQDEPLLIVLQRAVLDAVKKRDPLLAQQRMLELVEAAYGCLEAEETNLSRQIAGTN